MIQFKKVDIFDWPCNLLIHQANCFHTMGAGIARVIASKYPEAQVADISTPPNMSKMGTWSEAMIDDEFSVMNMYTQGAPERGVKATSYDACHDAFEALSERCNMSQLHFPIKISIPFLYGSDIAGGNFHVILALLKQHFGSNDNVDMTICVLPEKWKLAEAYFNG
jgi:hypothetical protein